MVSLGERQGCPLRGVRSAHGSLGAATAGRMGSEGIARRGSPPLPPLPLLLFRAAESEPRYSPGGAAARSVFPQLPAPGRKVPLENFPRRRNQTETQEDPKVRRGAELRREPGRWGRGAPGCAGTGGCWAAGALGRTGRGQRGAQDPPSSSVCCGLAGHWLPPSCGSGCASPLRAVCCFSLRARGGAGACDSEQGVEELPPPARPAVPGWGWVGAKEACLA